MRFASLREEINFFRTCNRFTGTEDPVLLFSRMRYVAAYLLAVLGGNESPTSKDLKKILDSVGIETDDERMNKVALPLSCSRWSWPSRHQTLELFPWLPCFCSCFVVELVLIYSDVH